jgi:hypothetical protein
MNHECPQEQEDLLSQTSLRFNLLSLICIFYLWQLDACSYFTDIVYAYVVSHFNSLHKKRFLGAAHNLL